MSNPAIDAAQAESARRKVRSAYDDPGTAEEITRRTFMANCTLALSGIIGLGLVIPIVGSLVPKGNAGGGTWSPLKANEWKQLQAATDSPVKLNFTLKSKDAYLPEEADDQFVWGIKADEARMRKARPDLFSDLSKAKLPYPVVTLGFVVFSPICPHLGCRYNYDAGTKKFLCPCHGSQYTYEGAHVAGPAPRGLDPLPLRERQGEAEVTWIRYQDSTADRIVVSYTA
ncbi:MAG: ubiquinol-cytochrome c reductase iron-sulfur subunit [Candidatus Eremiobacteraeota bacterium]|nr:ubiquinol-cytochrome c reductase iron-sulfur subunit [Candidatus Eremiobacteraeota bacterium]